MNDEFLYSHSLAVIDGTSAEKPAAFINTQVPVGPPRGPDTIDMVSTCVKTLRTEVDSLLSVG